MSTEEAHKPGGTEFPTFDLAYRFDDPEDPAEVTVFPPDSGSVTAEWISTDVRHAVPLDQVA